VADDDSERLPAWDLSTVYPGPADPAIDGAVRSVADNAQRLAVRWRGRLAAATPEQAAAALAEYEACLSVLHRVSTYAELRLAVSADEPAALALLDRCDAAWAAIIEELGFVERELGESTVDVPQYRGYLCAVRRAADGQAGPTEAATLARLDPVAGAGWARLSRQLLSRIRVGEPGGHRSLGEALPVLYEADRDLRARSCAAISRALEPEAELRATALSMVARSRAAVDAVRGVDDWMFDEHLANRTHAAETAALADLAAEHRETVHRYYRAKAGVLGGELTDADRYAPVGRQGGPVSWRWACEMVLDGLAAVAPELAEAASRVLDTGGVDARPRLGKRRGAVTITVPGGQAYVLVNFTGQLRDVLTLAHELGHAVHASLSGGRGMLTASAPQVLAEAVALFTEAAVCDRMGRALEPAAALALTARRLEDQLVAVFRHAALHRFEEHLHAAARRNQTLTADQLSAVWLAQQRDLYGDGVRLTDGYRLWWSYLDSFFVTPGSSIGYAYGQLAGLALLSRHRADPAGFRPRYLELLAAGGSRSPAELLEAVGLRTTDPAGWQPAMLALRRSVEEFAQLTAQPATAQPATAQPATDLAGS
jgi:oligoendopeptidase F